MHNNIPTYDHSVPWVVFVLFSREEKEEDLGQKKKLEKLLAYHHRLVVEKGLPPSRLMEEHAAASPAPTANSTSGKQFKCDQCDFASDSQRGLKVHVGRSHKDPEVLRVEDHEVSLNLSEISEIREDNPSVKADISFGTGGTRACSVLTLALFGLFAQEQSVK